MILNLIISPIFPVVVPYITRKIIKFSAQQYGFLETSFTIGMLIGNFIFALFLSKSKAKKLMVFGLFFFLIMNTMFSFAVFPKSINYFGGPTWEFFALLASIMAIMGLSMPVMNTPVMTNMQKMVPNNLRSRVFSVSNIISQAGVPLGAAIYGFMLDKIPAHYIYLGANILCLGFSIFVFIIAPDEMFDPGSEKITTEEL
jgi:sugar phosphate permease